LASGRQDIIRDCAPSYRGGRTGRCFAAAAQPERGRAGGAPMLMLASPPVGMDEEILVQTAKKTDFFLQGQFPMREVIRCRTPKKFPDRPQKKKKPAVSFHPGFEANASIRENGCASILKTDGVRPEELPSQCDRTNRVGFNLENQDAPGFGPDLQYALPLTRQKPRLTHGGRRSISLTLGPSEQTRQSSPCSTPWWCLQSLPISRPPAVGPDQAVRSPAEIRVRQSAAGPLEAHARVAI